MKLICLTASERTKIIKLVQSGLAIWLDPQNSDGKTFDVNIKKTPTDVIPKLIIMV